MDFAYEAVGALLSLGGEVAVGQVVTVKGLVAANVGGVEDRQRETWESAHVRFVGGEGGKSVVEVL